MLSWGGYVTITIFVYVLVCYHHNILICVYHHNICICACFYIFVCLRCNFLFILVLAGHVPNASRRMRDIRFSNKASWHAKQAYTLVIMSKNPRLSNHFWPNRCVHLLPLNRSQHPRPMIYITYGVDGWIDRYFTLSSNYCIMGFCNVQCAEITSVSSAIMTFLNLFLGNQNVVFKRRDNQSLEHRVKHQGKLKHCDRCAKFKYLCHTFSDSV